MARLVLASYGLSLPATVRSPEAIAEHLRAPLELVTGAFGLLGARVGRADDWPCALAASASRQALAKAGMEPEALGALIYAGDTLKERPNRSGAIAVAHAIGARSAQTFDVFQTCSSVLLGVHLAAAMLRATRDAGPVLVASGFRAPRTSPGFDVEALHVASWSTCGGAALLHEDGCASRSTCDGAAPLRDEGYELLSSEVRSDGTMSDAIVLTPGGTLSPDPPGEHDPPRGLELLRPEELEEWMADRWLDAWIDCAHAALRSAGVEPGSVAAIALQFVPPARAEALAEALGVAPERIVVARTEGHAGPVDPLLALDLAEREGRLDRGDYALLLATGTGFSWAATVLRRRPIPP